MKLYNMDTQEWRGGGFERNDSWRSTSVYCCSICFTKTNKWFMNGPMAMGPRIICNGDNYKEHDLLEAAIKEQKALTEKILDFRKMLKKSKQVTLTAGKRMLSDLFLHRALVEEKILDLRGKFHGRLHDVRGLGRKPDVVEFYPTSRISLVKKKSISRIDKK